MFKNLIYNPKIEKKALDKTLELIDGIIIEDCKYKDNINIQRILTCKLAGASLEIHNHVRVKEYFEYYINKLIPLNCSAYLSNKFFLILKKFNFTKNIIIDKEINIDYASNKSDVNSFDDKYVANHIFFASMDNYINPMVEIIKEIGEESIIVIPCQGKKWGNYLKNKSNIKFVFFEDFIDNEDIENYFFNKTLYSRAWKDSKKEIILKLDEYFGKNILNEDQLEPIYSELIPLIILEIEVVKKIINTYKPKTVNCSRIRRYFENSIISTARDLNIKTSMFIHGNITSNEKYFFSDGFFYADNIFVWGNYQKQIITSKNKYCDHIGKIHVVGFPLIKVNQFKMQSERPIITFMSDKYNHKSVKYLNKLAQKLKDVNFYVKIHPNDNRSYYEKRLSKRIKNRVSIIENTDMKAEEVINKSCLVISNISTVNFEVALYEVPLVLINYNKKSINYALYNDYLDLGMQFIESFKELYKVSKNIICSENFRKEYLKEQRKNFCNIVKYESNYQQSVIRELLS